MLLNTNKEKKRLYNHFISLIGIILALFILASCAKKSFPKGINIEPAEEIGTMYFYLKPIDLIQHPILQQNNELKKRIDFDSLEKEIAGKKLNFLKNVKTVMGSYSSINGIEELMILLEGDFSKTSWKDLFKKDYKKTKLKRIGRQYTYYKSSKFDNPSVLASKKHIIFFKAKNPLKVQKKVTSPKWRNKIKAEFSDPLIQSSLKEALLLFSYHPPKNEIQNLKKSMEKELDTIPIYLPFDSFKRIVFGLGQSGNNLTHFEALEMDNAEDIRDIKDMIIGFKGLYRLLVRNMKPVKKLIEDIKVVESKTMVGVAGSLSSTDVNNVVSYVKKKYIGYNIAQKKKWASFGANKVKADKKGSDDYATQQKKLKAQSEKLVNKVMKAFSTKKYRLLSPMISKKLKHRLNSDVFLEIATKIKSFGKLKNIKVLYPYSYDNKGQKLLNVNPNITFIKSGSEMNHSSSFTFVKEGKKYKLLKMSIY